MLSAIVLAAGKGARLKNRLPKPLVKIGGRPAIIYALESLERHPRIGEIVLVLSAANRERITRFLRPYRFRKIKALVLGGRRRQDSVYNGLKAVSTGSEWVLVHDSARPFIGSGLISRVVAGAKKSGAALPAVKAKATIKFSEDGRKVKCTLDRDKLWEAQTPQVFRKELLAEAYRRRSRGTVTDDASLLEKMGRRVNIVEGDYENIKITTADDLLIADFIARKRGYAV
jgi:2-C-methyl-D-erythritol 4-phosphate cytidylyltransferase